MKKFFVLTIALFSFLFIVQGRVYANQDYLLAKDFAEGQNKEFAFMHFLSVLKDDPEPRHREQALFACAEYYFSVRDYIDSFNTCKKFLEDYPHSGMGIFAFFYLLKISESWGNYDLAKTIEKYITGQKRVVLLFKENQEYNFKSPLGSNYKLIYYIDKLELYLDGKLQKQIFY